MPFAGFRCDKCRIRMNREEAFLHWAPGGSKNPLCTPLPGALIEAIWRHEEQQRREGESISPSMAGGCMREHAIKRTGPYYLEPRRGWKMLQGTLWHEILQKYCPPGYQPEVIFPDPLEDVKNITDPRIKEIAGVRRFEIFPGLFFSWVIDLLKSDYTEIGDYKTRDCPPGQKIDGEIQYWDKDFGVNYDYRLQLSIYSWGTKMILGLDAPPKPLIWRLTSGMQDLDKVWKYQEVDLIDYDDLEKEVRPNYEMFLSAMQGKMEVREMPLQGLTMYNGTKCIKYCGVKEECDALVPFGQTPEKWEAF